MTPKARQQHIEAIQTILTTCGFTKDSYGNYKNQLNNITYRAKFKTVNLRLEYKVGINWINISSKPVSQVSLESISTWAAKFKPTNQTKG